MPGQRRPVNLRLTFLGVKRGRGSYILGDVSARRLLAATPKTGFVRLASGRRRASRANGCEFPSVYLGSHPDVEGFNFGGRYFFLSER